MPTLLQTSHGKVTGIWGSALLRGADGQMRALKIGDEVHRGDVILTTQDGIVQLTLDPATNRYAIDLDENGSADFTIPNPAFSVRELRSNLVLRWEFRPGSTLFVVWSEARDDKTLAPGLDFGRDGSRLFSAPARDVFLVKLSYWLGR